MRDNWAEVFTVTDTVSHDKAVSSEPYLRHTEFWRLCEFTNYPCVPESNAV